MGHRLQHLLSAAAMLHFVGFALAAPTKNTSPVGGNPTTTVPMPSAVSGINNTWNFEIKPESSVFAVVTQKAGIAARLAHNHLIAAKTFEAKLQADPTQLNKGSFSFKTKANELEVDQVELQKKWFPAIQSLGWLKEPFTALKESDRNTIREHMLAKNQLNSDEFAEITAVVKNISDVQSTVGQRRYFKKASVSVTLTGKTIAREMPVNLTLQGQELEVEAAGEFKFTEFGIQPYKALLGALGNDDQFFMFVSFKAVKK